MKSLSLLCLTLLFGTFMAIYGQTSDLKDLNLKGKVKTLEINTYLLEFPNTEDFRNRKVGDYTVDYENGIRTFNADGNIVTHFKYHNNKGDIDKHIIYEYSPTGKFSSVKTFNLREEWKEYDRSEIADSNGRVILEIENGRKTYDKKFKFNLDGTVKETTIYLYNKQGEIYQKQIETKEYYKGTKKMKKETQEYRNYPSDTYIGGVAFELDSLGRTVTFESFRQTLVGEGKSVYKYNSKQNNDYTLQYLEKNTLKKTTIVKCDKYDNIISEIFTDNLTNITTYINYQYEYDLYGNWVKKITPIHDFSLGTYKTVTYRTVTYY